MKKRIFGPRLAWVTRPFLSGQISQEARGLQFEALGKGFL